ncbi:acyl-CoA dehydrogenase family protein [Glaciimonas sp. PCH181]|uniref:acyl-CoA dehydrogenase family protein n=1 Tax=Glaciimonas sp. PCH181 TaxID=2133943 RepID=UPI001374BFCB|nr:acyl-CoA dehydrogenase family protein [Glaciimonas sp. PCH181]
MTISEIPAVPDVGALLIAAEHLSQELALAAAAADRHRLLPFDAMHALRRQRLGALRVPQAYGGAGATWDAVAKLFILLAQGDASVAQAFLSHYVFVERLRLMGSHDQCLRLLPLAAGGTLFGGAAAERGGRFRGELATRLTADGAGYRLNGTKHYSTGALFADVLKIRALDERDRMISVLIPADRAGIERIDDWNGMGQRCTASGTTTLSNVAVAADEIMPMAVWTSQRHHTGAAAQIIHCAIDAGIALAAVRDATSWIRSGSLDKSDPHTLHTLGRMAARAHAAEAIVLSAAQTLENAAHLRFSGPAHLKGQADVNAEAAALDASLATARAKIISTQAALEVTQKLFDIGGIADQEPGNLPQHRQHDHLDRHWRNARTHTTHDPVAYKCRAIGDYLLNGNAPPLTFSY